ncbi:lipoprotein [Bradyrhizobium sp. G127]|uniref:LPS translocon maturation chaperone LptM n=1 Tax=Bradyrhizobium sp. G127 TaxID=2904800 RepID=UPI001F3335DA|nr:lipoprotein [Bradyrhizobium sp. G127]
MTSRSNRSFSKLTVVALIALTCALAGCGRKAGLDLPPGASADQQERAAAADAAAAADRNSASNLQSEVYRPPGTSSIAVAPRGEKKRIPLDAILD